MSQKESWGVLVQRLIGVAMVFFLFIYLIEKWQEVPEIVQYLLVASVATLIVWVETVTDFLTSLFKKKK